MAEASVREGRLLASPGTRAEPGVAVGTLCKVLRVSPKLGLTMVNETDRTTNRKPGK